MKSNLITGLGLLTCSGKGVEENYNNFVKNKNGIKTISKFDLPTAKVKTNFAGLIQDLPDEIIDKQHLDKMSKDDLAQDYVKAAVYTCMEAVADAGIAEAIKKNPKRTALIVASSLGNYLNVSELVKDYFLKDLYKITSLVHGMNSYIPSKLGSLLGVSGPCFFVSSSCTSALNALLQADCMIKSGIIDRAIVCGVDICLETGTYHLWNKIRVLSKRTDSPETACRPYCKTRDGMVVSEGAGCCIIERPEVVKGKAYASVDGIGMSNGSENFLKPSPDLIEESIVEALQKSGCDNKIDFIAGSASGSPFCDHYETDAVVNIFKQKAAEIPMISYKSFLGTTFGIQAVSEGALAIKTMYESTVPEPINIFEPDERVKANTYYKASDYKGYEINRLLFINYGFAGNHMAAVFSKVNN